MQISEGTAAGAAATSGAETTERADPLSEAVDAAIAEVTGEGGASDTPTTTETERKPEPEEEAAAEKVAPSKTEANPEEERADEGESSSEEEKKKADSVEFYTPKDYEEIDLFDLDMERVPPELRPSIRKAKATITRRHQVEAQRRREESQQPNSQKTEPTKKAEATELSDDELWEKAMESPAGMREAFTTFMRQNLPQLAEEQLGVNPERMRQEEQTSRVREAIELASDLHPELLNDDAFKSEVGKQLASDPRFQRAVSVNDPEMMSIAIEAASSRVKLAKDAKAKTESQRATAEAQRKAAEAKAAKEKATAQEKGSKAAQATTHSPAPKPGGGKLSMEEAMEKELKSGGYRYIR